MNHYQRNLFFDMDTLPEGTRAYLFGAGAYGRNLLGGLRERRPDVRVLGFIDSALGGTVEGLPVSPPDEIGECDTVILATPCWHSMGAALLDRGVTTFSVVRHDPAMVHSVFRSPDNRVMYTVCSRTGSSSVLTAMGMKPGDRLEVLPAKREDDPAYAFTFVRNPFNRVVSCYHGHLNGNLSPFGRSLLRLLGRRSISFPEFVRWLRDEPAWAMDNHLRPYSLLVPAWTDHVGRLEDTGATVDHLRERTGYRLELGWLFASNRRSRDYKPYYTPELRAVVEQVYADDLDRFGYDY